MMTVITNDDAKEFRGISTDAWPLGLDEDPDTLWPVTINAEKMPYRISNGSILFVMDTSEVYMYVVIKATASGANNTAYWQII